MRRDGATKRRASGLAIATLLLATVGPAGPAAATPSHAAAAVDARQAATVERFFAAMTEPIADGVARRHGWWITSDGLQVGELIEVDPAAPGISLESSGPVAGVDARETVSSQAGRRSRDGHRVVAAINGDVWRVDEASKTKAPNGLQVQRGELLTGSTRAWPTLGFDAAETPRVGDVALAASVTVPGGKTLAIDRFNKSRRSGDLVLYSRRWGSSTESIDGGVEVILATTGLPLRPRGTWTAKVSAVRSPRGDTTIMSGTLVLSADGPDEAALRGLTPGATVTLRTSITAGWEDVMEAIGGREWLIDDGQVGVRPVTAVTTESHPRTAVGIKPDGRLILATVDGRQRRYSVGVTANDLAGLLLAQGATEAIMLDGGGSTTALARRPGMIEAALVNRPSDGEERKVANALLVVSSVPTGPLARLVVRPSEAQAVMGETVDVAVGGVDEAGNGVALTSSAATWTMSGTGGTLSGPRFRATEPGTATVSAVIGTSEASATVTVVADTFAPLPEAPTTHLRRGARTDAGAVPVTIDWLPAADVGTDVARYELQRRLDGGSWTDVAAVGPATRSIAQTLPPGHAVEYQLRAIDGAGNASAWRIGRALVIGLVSERAPAVDYERRWRTARSSAYLDGAVRWARRSGATATFRFTGTEIAWIATRGPNRGTARVSIDGRVVATVRLHSSEVRPRRVVYGHAWQKPGRHRITIRVSGTAGHPRVDVDGFIVVDGP